MKLFKKGLVLFTTMAAFLGVGSVCRAEIIPPKGPGQIGLSAVVLCDTLNVREERSSDSEAVKALHYGDKLMVTTQKDGWSECVLSDDVNAGPEGWVNSAYIAVDPAWFKADETTTVYAWNDTDALKVGQVSKDTTLPILKDDGKWLVVSLRGASGWIQKKDAGVSAASDQSKKAAETESSAKEADTKKKNEQSGDSSDQADWFTVYAKDGSTANIRHAEGAMFEDAKGRTYSHSEAYYYYCITTDVTYASDPSVWDNQNVNVEGDNPGLTGRDYGENDDADEYGLTGRDYGENDDYDYDDDDNNGLTGRDYGENDGYDYDDDNDGLTGRDYGENEEYQWTGADFGENPDYEYDEN